MVREKGIPVSQYVEIEWLGGYSLGENAVHT